MVVMVMVMMVEMVMLTVMMILMKRPKQQGPGRPPGPPGATYTAVKIPAANGSDHQKPIYESLPDHSWKLERVKPSSLH